MPYVTMTKQYDDGSLRIISKEKLSVGDKIVYKNPAWIDVECIITDIKEERPALGEWTGDIPYSYHLITL